jgi:hypothetical protein
MGCDAGGGEEAVALAENLLLTELDTKKKKKKIN